MNIRSMTPAQIQETGLVVLARELGPVGMVRFLHQFELGYGDYTAEREQWLGKYSVDDLFHLLQQDRRERGKDERAGEQ